MSKVTELYGLPTESTQQINWKSIVKGQRCPFINRKCIKVRKSAPEITIGTCSVAYGKGSGPIIICPCRLLERRQIFTDSLHLLSLHEPGNELHIISEITLPGGSVDYFVVSAKDKKVKDFVGIEIQTLDTTGTVWPERQRFLKIQGIKVTRTDLLMSKVYGMNWKMTAKTTLVQLHHKVQTFENINKHLVLVIQEEFLQYMRREFQFDHLNSARLGDVAHFHAYQLGRTEIGAFRLELGSRLSTDANGVAKSLGLQANPRVDLVKISRMLEARISEKTLLNPMLG